MFTTKESIHLPYIVMYNMIANMKEIAFQLIMTQILMHGVSLTFFGFIIPVIMRLEPKQLSAQIAPLFWVLGKWFFLSPLTHMEGPGGH